MSLFGNVGHPIWRLAGTVGRLPRYLQLARSLFADENVPTGRKAVLGAALAYTISPIDLVPGVIPVAGQLDDLAVLLLGVRQALAGCPPEVAAGYLADAGLSAALLEDDLRSVQDAAKWLVGQTAAWGMRAVSGGLRALAGLSRRAGAQAPPPRG
ncbi:MAG TPA: YkvA family protein [Chloroflexota bacterium]|jgi:uncharacterized membrane protein YkvA (DUF1232 family)|nr:YkvA family protein [Chloroflexota bacterium]